MASVTMDSINLQEPGAGAPLMSGLRVLELGTVVAVPLVGRMLAELGAQVIKVEPPAGDSWRKTFLEMEQHGSDTEQGRPRTFTTTFEVANLGKESVVIDYSQPKGMAQLWALLEEADVFVTNVRQASLVKAGLDESTVRARLPQLVYGQLSAYGVTGPANRQPGYDIGAFWAGTGMAALLHRPGMYNVYPIGNGTVEWQPPADASGVVSAFGDAVAASSMVAGLCMALTQMLRTGEGDYVDLSLHRTGCWVLASAYSSLNAPLHVGDVNTIPDYHTEAAVDPLHTHYHTKSGFLLITELGADADLKHLLATALSLTNIEAVLQNPVELHRLLSQKLRGMDLEEATQTLQRYGVGCTPCTPYTDIVLRPFEACPAIAAAQREIFASIPGVVDLPRVVQMPFRAHCSTAHGFKTRAPAMGQHNGTGWDNRASGASLDLEHAKGVLPKTAMGSSLLDGVRVVELSEHDLTAAGVGTMLADYGATVHAVGPWAAWRARHPTFIGQMNKKKQTLEADLTDPAAIAELKKLIAASHIFVTNIPETELLKLGLDWHSIKAQHAALVYCLATPWGMGSTEPSRGSLGAWWAASGLASMLAGMEDEPPPNLPDSMGSLVCSTHLAAGAMAALFHLQRTGEGQLVDVSLLHCGLWANMFANAAGLKDNSKLKMFQLPLEELRLAWPLPTAGCHQTLDGMWVQLLGADILRHFGTMSGALNCKCAAYCALLSGVCCIKCCPCLGASGSVIDKIRPTMRKINPLFEDGMHAFTYEEFKQVAYGSRLDGDQVVWHQTINMPINNLEWHQAHHCKTFTFKDPQFIGVNSPLQFASHDHFDGDGRIPTISSSVATYDLR